MDPVQAFEEELEERGDLSDRPGAYDPAEKECKPAHRRLARFPLGQAGLLHDLCILLHRPVPAHSETNRKTGSRRGRSRTGNSSLKAIL